MGLDLHSSGACCVGCNLRWRCGGKYTIAYRIADLLVAYLTVNWQQQLVLETSDERAARLQRDRDDKLEGGSTSA